MNYVNGVRQHASELEMGVYAGCSPANPRLQPGGFACACESSSPVHGAYSVARVPSGKTDGGVVAFDAPEGET